LHHIEADWPPQVTSGIAESGINLHTNSAFHPLQAEHCKCSGIKAASADRGIGEPNRPQSITRDRLDVADNLQSEGEWRPELT
jgi:hypothetical protein